MALPLICGFMISATAVFALVAYVGDAIALGRSFVAGVLVATILVLLAAVEILPFPIRRSVCRRQTPKVLVSRYHRSVGGFLWGLDTGTVVSTYRVSVASWATLVLCATGRGGPWIGMFYGLGFCVPLAVVLLSWAVPRAPSWLFAKQETANVFDLISRSAPRVLWLSAGITFVCAGLLVSAL